MTKNLMSNVRFQLRLVKELRGYSRGRLEIITFPPMGKSKERAKDDKTIELLCNESAALKIARDYCRRGDERKGLPLGQEFRGVVVTRYEGDPKCAVPILVNIPYRRIGRRKGRRVMGTTNWLYYIEPETCKVFHIDTTPPGDHLIGEPI